MTQKPKAAAQGRNLDDAPLTFSRGFQLPGTTDGYVPKRAGGYVRISDDPFGLERGVTRQTEDIYKKAEALGWTVVKIYPENDTSAYRKRRVTLPDGTIVMRVVRPQWDAMLDDFRHGRIDGIIVYDQDRLLRQPRDLEDLIDLVELVHRPVTGITSSINLMTSDGRAMARVMAAMALKSSEDTARRVSRAKLADAAAGKIRTVRRFGWTADGELIEDEAEAIRKTAAYVLKTGSWTKATIALEKGKVRPVGGGHFHVGTVRNTLLSPTIAGLAVYRGANRPRVEGKMNAADPAADAIKDAKGEYVKNGLPEILDVATWEALCKKAKDAHDGKPPTVPTTKKYLLSGLLRCCKLRENGTMCGRSMVGTYLKREAAVVYKCPGIAHGGCGGSQRRAVPLEELIEELLFGHLQAKAPRRPEPTPAPKAPSKTARQLDTVQERLTDMQRRYAEGDPDLSKDTYYTSVPIMEGKIRELSAQVAAEQPGPALRQTAEQVAAEWKDADTAGKRAILTRYLHAIEVRPSAARGKAKFDHNAITPVWKKTPKR
jgi:DNA invertase Pin-like site-specific DNA recombinase